MLELVTNATRLYLARARRTAYFGKIDAAIESLVQRASDSGTLEIDRIALRCTQAELLHLDGQYSAAHEVFSFHLDAIPESVPESVRFVIGFNRADVASSMFDSEGTSRFYDLADELHLAGIDHWDDSAVLSASISSGEGRGYESLPIIWRELRRTYELGRWATFRRASRHMGKECIRLGQAADAVYHCTMACDTKFGEQLAIALLAARRADILEVTFNNLMRSANLLAHFMVACAVIQSAADGVPDHQIDSLIRWMLSRAGRIKEPTTFSSSTEVVWKTIAMIASRASSDVATEIVEAALKHSAWVETPELPNQFIRSREELIDAVNQAVTAVPAESLEALAVACLPLATTRRNFKDFGNAVNLLGHIVHRSTDDVKRTIRDSLYPKGKGIPPILMQTASHFGQEITNNNKQLDAYADGVVANLLKVVQHLALEEDPSVVYGQVMTFTSTRSDEKLVVHLISVDDIRGMARNRRQFTRESIGRVVEALATSAADPDNLLDNRLVFIDCIKDFADCMNEEHASRIWGTLRSIATGEFDVSSDLPSGEEGNHSLNRTRVKGATRNQLRGHAIFVLACIDHEVPGVFGTDLQSIVEQALSSPSSDVRKRAFAAVREMSALTEKTWAPLLLATRDPDEMAAALAFDAIASRKDAQFTRPQWRMLAYSLRSAQLYASIELRRAAAASVAALTPQVPKGRLRTEFVEIRQAFMGDIAFSVRSAIK
ncbi:MAG: hypothetical protein U1A77_00060 [Pirellulales bacterium]